MRQINEHVLTQTSPWFKTWFYSPFYQNLYRHWSEEEAAGLINELCASLQPKENAKMLDVGCGTGRHCRHLAAKGFNVTGIDLSSSSIRQAKKYETASLRFFRHDLTQAFGKDQFDYVFNFLPASVISRMKMSISMFYPTFQMH